MTHDATAGLGRWRSGRSPDSSISRNRIRTRKWLGEALLSVLLVIAAGIVGWIIWEFVFPRTIAPDFVPFLISDYQKPAVPPLPWVAADRNAIEQVRLFPQKDQNTKTAEELTLRVAGERLARLQKKNPKDAVVVYVAAHALVDSSGAVQIVVADSDPYATKTLLPLSEVLASLKACPAQKKLLVLDLMSTSCDPFVLGGTSDGLADVLRDELASADQDGQSADPRAWVLLSCSPGEAALWSEQLGKSVFGHYFQAAFSDPEADTDDDRAVTVTELAAYLEKNVDHWARQHRGARQRPMLIRSAGDFPLAPLDRRRVKPTVTHTFVKKAAPVGKQSDQAKPAEKEAAGGQAKAADPAKKTGEEPANESEKSTAKSTETEELVYPPWLTDFWRLRDAWIKSGDYQSAPRVARCLETLLIRAERAWRMGEQPENIQSSLRNRVRELSAEMDRARNAPPFRARSVGQARAFGRQSDAAMSKALKEVQKKRRNPEPFATAEQVKASLDTAVKGFLETLKGKTSLDLATAIVEAAEGEKLDRDTLTFLDSIVVQSKVELDVVELRLLRQLALRAARAGEWDDESARTVWNTVYLAEQANYRPLTGPWVRALLDQADAQLHEAAVLVLPKTHGFTSPGQIDDAWQRTSTLYQFVDTCQQRIQDARNVLNRARSTLSAYIPYLATAGGVEDETLWLDVARTAHELDNRLIKPDVRSESAIAAQERMQKLNNPLSELTIKVESRLKELLKPFEPDTLRDLARQAQGNHPKPDLAATIEAILATPFPSAEERAKLWSTSFALDARLDELPVSGSDAKDSGIDSDRIRMVRELVGRRTEASRVLLKLAGIESAAQSEPAVAGSASESHTASRAGGGATALSEVARLWGGLARFSENAYYRLVDLGNQSGRPDRDDRPGWIAPAYILSFTVNPIRQSRDQDEDDTRAWLAEHYRQQSLDLHDPFDPPKFYATAALEWQGADQSTADAALELGLPDRSAAGLNLSRKNNKAEVNFRVILREADPLRAQVVALKVLKPADSRLRLLEPPPTQLELPPHTEREVGFRVEWVETDAPDVGPPPAGLIVQASLPNGRPYHLRVPVTIVSESRRPRLVLSSDPVQSNNAPFERLLVRTVPGRQRYFVFVRNPFARDFNVIVEVAAGLTPIATSDPKGLLVKGPSEVLVPSFGAPALKDTDDLPEAPQVLTLRLRDAATSQVLDELSLQPVIASPLEYLEVIQPRFIPARTGESNRLEVTLRSLPQMTGPPCRVKLIVPSDRELFPAYLEPPKGVLERDLEPGGKKVLLAAEEIKLDLDAKKEEGLFQLTIDGLERNLWYQTRFVSQGEPQIAIRYRAPRVRFEAIIPVKQDQPAKLLVKFTVDNAPPDARLSFHLGQYKRGEFVDVITPWEGSPKRQHLGFDPRGAGGALHFEAAVADWTKEFDIAQIRGLKRLQAYLTDGRSREVLDSWGTDLALDDLPPQNAVLTVDSQVEKGTTRLPVKATVKIPESGMKEVAFIVGSKAEFAKSEVDGKIFQGKPTGSDRSAWSVELPLSKDAGGKVVVTARFTSGTGLTTLASEDVQIVEPAPSPEEAAAKPAPEKPGGIQGKVTENDIKQPGLIVYLIDPKAKDDDKRVKSQTTTKADGTFAFSDLMPGLYQLRCLKEATNRREIKDVTVPSGTTVQQDLDLMIP
jgi:hypothetical protein